MNIVIFLKECILGSLNSVFTIAKIVIPLMIIIEILKDYNVLNKITKYFKPISKFFGISSNSTFPLVVGLTLGLSYGAGIIIDSAKAGELSKKDLYLVVIFLGACHAVFEDTLLFVALGANGWLLLGFRLVVAILITYFISENFNKCKKINKLKG